MVGEALRVLSRVFRLRWGVFAVLSKVFGLRWGLFAGLPGSNAKRPKRKWNSPDTQEPINPINLGEACEPSWHI